jgi:hypothetical protein
MARYSYRVFNPFIYFVKIHLWWPVASMQYEFLPVMFEYLVSLKMRLITSTSPKHMGTHKNGALRVTLS